MTATTSGQRSTVPPGIKSNLSLLVVVVLLVALPFLVAILDGQSIAGMLASEPGQSKFVQGLAIEIFILGVYAISYDLVLGVTGLLSFGQAMFFAVGAYLTGVMLKSFGWPLLPTLGLVTVAGVLQALLFGIVLPRVSGLTFALVTLGIASVFDIVIRTREAAEFTGADVGLQGIPRPDFINPASARLTFYYLALVIAILVFLLFKRFVNSPTGRVCIAIRENEDRAKMLGFNTFYFKLAALILAAIAAGYAGAMNALYMPIVSPDIATMGYTVQGLLIILIGGMGTLSGAMIGAAVYRLLDFYLLRWFGEYSGFIMGAVFVALVLFVPYGIVGTWRLRSFQWRQGWQRLINTVTGNKESVPRED
jgi:branched-chain amino acid transport system permease protein